MKTDEQYYRALAHNTAPSIGGQLLRGYFSRMAEAEAERLRKDMTAVRARRTQIRLEYRAAAKAAATQMDVREFAPGIRGTCFVFADGSMLRADSFS